MNNALNVRLRLGLLVLSGMGSAALGFILLTPDQALDAIRYGGYWVMALTTALFFVAIWRFLRLERETLDWRRLDWIALIMAGAATYLLLIHEPHGFKVLNDELVLAATSMSMHLDRQVFTPLHAHNFDGAYIIMGGIVDKRPFFFAFFVSLVHDLFGYRPGNVFFVNGALTFMLLVLTGLFARRLAGIWAGRFSILALAGLPLLAINATGGGFEIMNLCLILVCLMASASYLERGSRESLNLLVLAGILLAQTRYESVLFVIAIGALVLLGWIKRRDLEITPTLIAAPLLLVPYPLLNAVFQAHKGFWQLPDNVESPFHWSFLGNNLSHAVAFFFDFSALQSNSFFLSLLGGASLVALLVVFPLRFRKMGSLTPAFQALLAFGAVILANFGLLMFYHWGEVDQFVVSRLALPLCLLFVFASVFLLRDFKATPTVWKAACGLAGIFLLGVSVPVTAKEFSTQRFPTYRETAWFREFVLEHRDEGAFFVAPSPLVSIVYRQPCLANSLLAERAEGMKYHLDRGTYSTVYVFQRFKDDWTDNRDTLMDESVLGPAFVLETVGERQFAPNFRSRISRVASIDPSLIPEPDDESIPWRMIRDTIRLEDEDTPEGAAARVFIENLP
ncbi:MAG: hypothetical protein DRP71_08790 [Verrucomicrobia bacterium]|nr:MAG: hypothetical protein DRP71_08790 [Verrucomicrobiota bacterium]